MNTHLDINTKNCAWKHQFKNPFIHTNSCTEAESHEYTGMMQTAHSLNPTGQTQATRHMGAVGTFWHCKHKCTCTRTGYDDPSPYLPLQFHWVPLSPLFPLQHLLSSLCSNTFAHSIPPALCTTDPFSSFKPHAQYHLLSGAFTHHCIMQIVDWIHSTPCFRA